MVVSERDRSRRGRRDGTLRFARERKKKQKKNGLACQGSGGTRGSTWKQSTAQRPLVHGEGKCGLRHAAARDFTAEPLFR